LKDDKMKHTAFHQTGKTLSPDDRERLTLAYRAARLRCGLAAPTRAIGPFSLAHLLAALLRRLGVAR